MKRSNYTQAISHQSFVVFAHDWMMVNWLTLNKTYRPHDFLKSNTFGTEDGRYQIFCEIYPNGMNNHTQTDITMHLVKTPSTTTRIYGTICVVMGDKPVLNTTTKFDKHFDVFTKIHFIDNIFSPMYIRKTPQAYLNNGDLTIRIVIQVCEKTTTEVF